jgi:hypothetical protein
LLRQPIKPGMAIAAKMEKMAITVMSSIIENP